MKFEFTKMHGIGNDFVVIDAINQAVSLSPDMSRQIADRHFGIGCDQILIAESPRSEDVAFRFRILNADGSEVAQCGNGARCFARFVYEKGLVNETEFPVETANGVMILRLKEQGNVQVNMGEPELKPTQIPFEAEREALSYTVNVAGKELAMGVVSMGNPHAVLIVDSVAEAPVAELGPLLEAHKRFPERANVGFMQIESPQHIRLRVFERGAGETLACGSGACAAVVTGYLQGLLSERVKVDLPGGSLIINWKGVQTPVFLTGPTATVFEGKIEL
jgi:diaminopimelate epimerase